MDLVVRREADRSGSPEFVAVDIGGEAESPGAGTEPKKMECSFAGNGLDRERSGDANPSTTAWPNGQDAARVSTHASACVGSSNADLKQCAVSDTLREIAAFSSILGDLSPTWLSRNVAIPIGQGVLGLYEKQVLPVHVDGSPKEQFHPSTPTTGGAKRRRTGRRVPGWRDPRKILFAFAALSSVGTLILLYFTLSMGRMTGGQADGQ